MDTHTTSLGVLLALSFISGILSFVSPCVLPLVPVYLTYLGGAVTTEVDQVGRIQWRLFRHATLFIVGFGIVFVVLGAGLGEVGALMKEHLDVMRKVSGVVIVLMGITLLGIFNGPWNYLEKRFDFRPAPGMSGVRSFLFGLVFAAGWTPCVGPILGTILGIAISQDSASVREGAVLLAVYSLGLGVPFWLMALGVTRLTRLLTAMRRHMRAVSLTSGVFVMAMGVLLYVNAFSRLQAMASYLPLNGLENWLQKL